MTHKLSTIEIAFQIKWLVSKCRVFCKQRCNSKQQLHIGTHMQRERDEREREREREREGVCVLSYTVYFEFTNQGPVVQS